MKLILWQFFQPIQISTTCHMLILYRSSTQNTLKKTKVFSAFYYSYSITKKSSIFYIFLIIAFNIAEMFFPTTCSRHHFNKPTRCTNQANRHCSPPPMILPLTTKPTSMYQSWYASSSIDRAQIHWESYFSRWYSVPCWALSVAKAKWSSISFRPFSMSSCEW